MHAHTHKQSEVKPMRCRTSREDRCW